MVKCLSFYNSIPKTKCTWKKNSQFQELILVTERKRAMYTYVKLIVTQSLLLSMVEQKEFRSFSKFDVLLSYKSVRQTILNLVRIVEKRISEDLENSKGSIMYDGWTHDNTHYLGVFAVYMKKIRVFRNNEESFVEQLAIPLLSASPIGQYVEEYDTESLPSKETTEFNSTAHVCQLESVFNYFHLNVCEWAVCQVADNCSTNRRIAELMELPRVGCLSHKLHLDINDMITKEKRLETVIVSIHRTMKSCKTSLVNELY